MSRTLFDDIYTLSKLISRWLPLSYGLPLDGMVINDINLTNVKPQGEHWSIVSKTGGGKTFFVKRLIAAYRRKYPFLNIYILDSKKLGDFNQNDGPIIKSEMPPSPLTGNGQVQIWQPAFDDVSYYDEYFRAILATGKPAIVSIDETKNITEGSKTPKGYELLLSQGRLPGIFVLSNFQEIGGAALRQGFSQATHFVVFNVFNDYDRRMAANYMGLGDLPRLEKYSLLYRNIDRDHVGTIFKNCQQFIENFLM